MPRRREGDHGAASACRLCGRAAAGAFEQEPPSSAFEGDPAKLFGLDDWLSRRDRRAERGPKTLCEECAAAAAARYLPEYRRWCGHAFDLIESGPPADVLDHAPRPTWSPGEFRNVRPARFLKQLVTMLVAIAPPGFAADGHAELAAYARDPKRRGLPARYQIYLSLYRGPFARFVGYSARLGQATRRSEELVELAYPPFSCVLSLAGDADVETTNVSGFADLALDEVCIVDLDLLNGFGHTPYPADFRTLAAVERDRAASRRVA